MPSGPAFSLGVWNHLATTFDGSMLRVFVNGAEVASDPLTGSIATSTLPLRIGGNAVWDEWFAGEIDNLRVYDRALTGAEVQKDMTTAVTESASTDTSAPTAPSALSASGQTQTSITPQLERPSSDNVGVAGYGLYRDGRRCRKHWRRRSVVHVLRPYVRHELHARRRCLRRGRTITRRVVVPQTASTTACAQQPSDSQAPSAPGSLTIHGCG